MNAVTHLVAAAIAGSRRVALAHPTRFGLAVRRSALPEISPVGIVVHGGFNVHLDCNPPSP
jgi:hypothetical protein